MSHESRPSHKKQPVARGATSFSVILPALVGLSLLPLALGGCEEEAKKGVNPDVAAVAQPKPLLVEKPAAAPAAVPDPKPAQASRPSKVDFQVTDERRADVEKAYPEAKGFLVATTIEENLRAKKVNSEKPAIKAFDAAAKGKWVLFSGTMVNLTEDGFDLGVTYTPQLPGDVMGMSRQWFPITFSDITGYDKSKFKLGQAVVVLAKYAGDRKGSSGYELVDQAHWK